MGTALDHLAIRSASSTADQERRGDPGRWELLRAIGALTILDPGSSRPLSDALDLPTWSLAEHTKLFILDLPPFASIHLGPEGKLGGEGHDRVAGAWRALGLEPPSQADHLASLLGLYAHLGQAAETCRTDMARGRLRHAARTVLWEHLWPWVPGYLSAVAREPAGRRWSQLALEALLREARDVLAPPAIPMALRDAPEAIELAIDMEGLLDALVTPVRVGLILTHTDLCRAGEEIGAGVRRGERRFALRALFEQDPTATLTWLAHHSAEWAILHAEQPDLGGGTSSWWSRRAKTTASVLTAFAKAPAPAPARGKASEPT